MLPFKPVRRNVSKGLSLWPLFLTPGSGPIKDKRMANTRKADTRKATGAQGEQDTLGFLAARGYRIVDTNVRPLDGMARGEIDVVAWEGEYLVFCEVKTRRTAHGAQGTPAEAVDHRKQVQLTRLALAYIAKHNLDDVNCRFDVVEVVHSPPRPPRLTLLRDAFPPADFSEE